ncbi:hypothetical protein [Synechococcus phage S-SRP01]|uniref:Uncharacterized protein n=1 Tax=Synechococcus phage S-SRP01 TaxID=2781607 RepID=A0A874M9S5_9CAUD|nr:hypothetical protein [Synechococcus phage S-SRP01]
MTEHSTAVQVDVFPDEFKPLLKLINHALINSDVMQYINDAEARRIYAWLDDFQAKALEHSV